MSQQQIRITPSFVILHDKMNRINKGVSFYLFATAESAKDFWYSSNAGSRHSAPIERVNCISKFDMMNRINDLITDVQYDKS